eukprot:scaffold146770_cov17-Tisochrysis_lutea.AAC.2
MEEVEGLQGGSIDAASSSSSDEDDSDYEPVRLSLRVLRVPPRCCCPHCWRLVALLRCTAKGAS